MPQESLEEKLLEQLAAFLKASFIYPSNNERVYKVCDELRRVFEELPREREFGHSVAIEGDDFRVSGISVKAATPGAKWLHDALLRARVGGVEISGDVTLEALHTFAEKLRASFARPDQKELNLLGMEFPGIRPLELRFSGRHDQAGVRAVARTGYLVHPRGDIMRVLQEDAAILSSVESLEEMVENLSDHSGASVRLDLLELISEALPVEALIDHRAARELVGQILERSSSRLEQLLIDGVNSPDDSLELALADIGRRFFKAQIDDVTAKQQQDLPEGRPGDEKIHEDLDAMLAEYHALPDGDELELRLEDEIYPRETAGVCLFQIVNSDDEDVVRNAMQLLAKLIAKRPEISDLLCSYVEMCVSEQGLTKEYENYWRVIDFIQDQGLDTLLEGRDFLRPEVVATTFPHQFVPFLDSLNSTQQDDLDKLTEACRVIGRKRLRAETEFLVHKKALITKSRVKTILSVNSDHVLPLVQMIVEHGEEWVRGPVAKFIFDRNTPTKEAAALLAVRPLSDLDPQYLAALCEPYLGRKQRMWLWDRSAYLLRKYLRRTADSDEPTKRRITAIDMLGLLPSLENLEALRAVAKEGPRLMLTADQRMLRKAAKDAVAAMQRRLKGPDHG
ncbi:MAG: hypothetical protein KDC87_04720 [Planctomycetes bacterium]|nr:hypothetical protein [Planctomycetota bacterium]MCB9870924.1 hypothetical protein [Planctomycetota bacterium]MCB9888288.1 hypothetical protein [Planctomycetota bacterium]